MFESLSKRLGDVFDRLKGRGALTESDVESAMREVRIALLEADVALPVVKDFIAKVKEKAVGQDVVKSVKPGQMVVKIVHDHLIEVLGGEESELKIGVPPSVILMAGLQGSGKTTSTAKIARLLQTKYKKKVLMASTDVYRPAAREQLTILATQADIDVLSILEEERPIAIADRALERAQREGYDVLLIDTAGRLHIDDMLMQELIEIKKRTKPAEIILVADAMTGQDAVNVAKSFHEQLGLTGITLTRLDGDARGGAALSMRSITGCPVKLAGVGERIEQIEEFDPSRIAGRILNMGDIVGLVEKAQEAFDEAEAEKTARKMQKGQFDLDDLADQLRKISKLGGLSGLMGMLPGIGKIKDKIDEAGIDDKTVGRHLAMISSMTPKERKNYKILDASRKKRIAAGSGTDVASVNRLLKQYQDMLQVMKRMNKLGDRGLKRHGLKGLFRK